jgi:hypothetical protein
MPAHGSDANHCDEPATLEPLAEDGPVQNVTSEEEVSESKIEGSLEDTMYRSTLALLIKGKVRGYVDAEQLSWLFHAMFGWLDVTPENVDHWVKIIRDQGIEWRDGPVHGDLQRHVAAYHSLTKDLLRSLRAVTSEASAHAFSIHAALKVRTADAETPDFNPGEFYDGFRQATIVTSDNDVAKLDKERRAIDAASEELSDELTTRLRTARASADQVAEGVIWKVRENMQAYVQADADALNERFNYEIWRIRAVANLGSALGVVAPSQPLDPSIRRKTDNTFRSNVTFWTYTNWVHKYAKVHRGSCSHCNDGRGSHGAVHSHAGQWVGPFDHVGEALQAGEATGWLVTTCSFCAPG